MNKVILIGNVGGTPEIKYFGERPKLKFSLATNEKWKDQSGEMKEKTEWHNVSIWGKRASALEPHIHSGDRIMVEGRIRYSKSEGEAGTRYFTDIDATEIELLGGSKGEYKPKDYGKPSEGKQDSFDSGDIPF